MNDRWIDETLERSEPVQPKGEAEVSPIILPGSEADHNPRSSMAVIVYIIVAASLTLILLAVFLINLIQ
ncbi:MAG: hypothetical protein IT328_13925 [Caldilineaceae bacterium]|nr:hypothetical protein [Caldilineaceae bacterium]